MSESLYPMGEFHAAHAHFPGRRHPGFGTRAETAAERSRKNCGGRLLEPRSEEFTDSCRNRKPSKCLRIPRLLPRLLLIDADKPRFGRAVRLFDAAQAEACVDHHVTNPHYAEVNLVVSDAAATAEIVYELYGHGFGCCNR